MHQHEIFPEKYLIQTVVTTPANISKPTVPGMQGNACYTVTTPLNSIKPRDHMSKKNLKWGPPCNTA